MNMFKKNGGFTLVELIVVIAILAILAGVAVPAYSGYLNSANKAADTTALAAVKTAVMATYATEGTVTEINFSAPSTLTAKVGTDTTARTVTTTAGSDFATYYGGALNLTLKTGATATWASTGTDANEWVISGTPSTSTT